MKDREPTVRARELGLALERTLKAQGMSQRAMAHRLGWSVTKLSRLINGKRGMPPEEVSALLAACRIIGPKRAELMELAKHAGVPGWWQEYGDRLPTELKALSNYEDSAIAITNFENAHVPGLLQTPGYMRSLMHATPAIPEKELDERVQVRLRRQQVFDRRYPAPPMFHFFLDEYAIARTGPGRAVASEQVHHLLRMSVRRNIAIRVVPDSVGFHAGQMPFHLMEFIELNSIVHIENQTSVLFLERAETIAGYRRTAAELGKVALDEGQSRAWLATLATELGEPREVDDEHAQPEQPHLAEE